MTDIHPQSAAAKGFAGLTHLASTLSAEPAVKPAPLSPHSDPITVKSDEEPVVLDAPKPRFWIRNRVMWAAIIWGICVIAYFNSSASRPSYSGMKYAPPSTSATRPSTPSASPAPSPSELSQPMKPPNAGANQILSQGEIKYCLAERVRLEAMNGVLDDTRSAHITNFNVRVDDFNSRCANYRYREADMTRARSEIDGMRAMLRSQAIEQVRGWR